MSAQFEISLVNAAALENAVFLLKYRGRMTLEQAHVLRAQWDQAWTAKGLAAPMVLVTDLTVDVSCLTEHELRDLGLMRIPQGEP